MGAGSFLGVKRPGRGVDYPPHLAPRLKKSRVIRLLLLWTFVACFRVDFTFMALFYVTAYILAPEAHLAGHSWSKL
jgi:hypothetical protein